MYAYTFAGIFMYVCACIGVCCSAFWIYIHAYNISYLFNSVWELVFLITYIYMDVHKNIHVLYLYVYIYT